MMCDIESVILIYYKEIRVVREKINLSLFGGNVFE